MKTKESSQFTVAKVFGLYDANIASVGIFLYGALIIKLLIILKQSDKFDIT